MTGRPGIGKTTVITKVIESLGRDRVGGFWSSEIRKSGRRVGFSIETVEGQRGILAHVNLEDGPRVGKYYVNVADIDQIAVPALRDALESNKIIVIDEIAKMELYSRLFWNTILECLDTKKVLATIQKRRSLFLDQIRNRDDIILLEINDKNRDTIPEIVLGHLTI